MLSMRHVVTAHLSRERLDVLLVVFVPLVMMVESGVANAWAFAGGHLGLDVASVLALFRGLFMEVLIFACFKMVKVFFLKGKWLVFFIPGLVGIVGMIISAGCNLGWMMKSGEMAFVLQVVVSYLPHWMSDTFRIGLGLLFPIGVGVYALFDVGHLIDDAIDSSHLDHRALLVNAAEMHRTRFLRSQQKAGTKVQQQYDQICEVDAQEMVERVRRGDRSFGANEIAHVQPVQSSVTRLNAPVLTPQLGPGVPPARPMASPFGQGQPTIQGQFGPAPTMHMGNTQNLNVPPPPMQPQQGGWFGNFLNGNR